MADRTDPMGVGLAVLNRLAGSPILDRRGLRRLTGRVVHRGARDGFRAAAAGRRFARAGRRGVAGVRAATSTDTGVFDLDPTEDQRAIVAVVRAFAGEVLRPGAASAEAADDTPRQVLRQSVDLGLSLLNAPGSLGGIGDARSAVTGVLVAEALAEGDLGQAVACLAPAAVSTALSRWGDEEQQQTYLPEFTGSDVPSAALAVAEPRALFDPLTLHSTGRADGDVFVLNGLKSAVVRGTAAEMFLVAADLEGRGPSLVLVEARAAGVTVQADPGMGLRAAGLARLALDEVRVGPGAVVGDSADYRSCLRSSRLAWAALALGTSRAVLDYVTPYVTTRTAFGEPIAHRQSVAFAVADMAIELEGTRLTTLRAASRLDRGDDAAREIAIARRLAGEYGMRIGTDGVQLLGGHGFVKEHPVERWYRDLRSIAVMEGGVLV